MTNYASTGLAIGISLIKTRQSKVKTEIHSHAGYSKMLMLAFVLSSAFVVVAADELRYRSGIRNSQDQYRLKPDQLLTLLENLRQKSGFMELRFDENEFLVIGDRTRISGGSALARNLLIAAVDRDRAIDLECHNRSPQVAFARLASSVNYSSRLTGEHIGVYPIQIDFSDFKYLRGDKAALEAFDIGFVFLHELAHAALGLTDALVNGQQPGECEEYINSIRRELGIPERQTYIARTHASRLFPAQSSIRKAELFFAMADDPGNKSKQKTHSLSWEADRVGGVRESEYKPQSTLPRASTLIAP